MSKDLNIDVAISELLATQQKPTYPTDHKAGMRVPKGGSSCASCEYLADNKTDCTNEYFQKWHGSPVIPAPIDEYCSDWYEHDGIEAFGTTEGAIKGWDTRGRGREGEKVKIQVYKRPDHPEPGAVEVTKYYGHPEPDESERARIIQEFRQVILGDHETTTEHVNFRDLIPMQGTLIENRFQKLSKAPEEWLKTHLPQVFEEGGKMYVIDGHHRIASDLKDGKDNGEVFVFRARHKIAAYGTSEGAVKGWDTRGRGRHEEIKTYPVKMGGRTIHVTVPDDEEDQQLRKDIGTQEAFDKLTEKEGRYYRGTTTLALERIAKEGALKQNPHPLKLIKVDPWFGVAKTIHSTKGYTYLTTNEQVAQYYAMGKQQFAEAKPGDEVFFGPMEMIKPKDGPAPISGVKPVVLTLKVPASIQKGIKPDPASEKINESYMFKGSIPAKYITGVKELDGTEWKTIDWKPPVKHRVHAEEEEPMLEFHFVLDSVDDLAQLITPEEEQELDVEAAIQELLSYGTSEGVRKEWDTRGRGRKQEVAGDGWVTKDGKFHSLKDMGLKVEEHGWAAVRLGLSTMNSETQREDAMKKGAVRVRHLSGFDSVGLESWKKDQSNLRETIERLPDYVKSIGVETYSPRHAYRDGLSREQALTYIGGEKHSKGYDPSFHQRNMDAQALFHGVDIEGFTGPGEEMIRAALSRVPPELLKNVESIVAAPQLQPIHGRYDPLTKTVLINPLIFKLRQRFGEGQGWIHHTELALVHEIGHSVYVFLPEKLKDEWREISGWMVGWKEGQDQPYEEKRPGWPHTTSNWTHKSGVKFTRKYATKNDDEDFADSFAFMMLNKPHQMAKEKREFLERLIKDQVKMYPQALIQGPEKAYGERGN